MLYELTQAGKKSPTASSLPHVLKLVYNVLAKSRAKLSADQISQQLGGDRRALFSAHNVRTALRQLGELNYVEAKSAQSRPAHAQNVPASDTRPKMRENARVFPSRSIAVKSSISVADTLESVINWKCQVPPGSTALKYLILAYLQGKPGQWVPRSEIDRNFVGDPPKSPEIDVTVALRTLTEIDQCVDVNNLPDPEYMAIQL